MHSKLSDLRNKDCNCVLNVRSLNMSKIVPERLYGMGKMVETLAGPPSMCFSEGRANFIFRLLQMAVCMY